MPDLGNVFRVREDVNGPMDDYSDLINAILDLLSPYEPLCPPSTTDEPNSTNGVKELSIIELERRAHIQRRERYYLLPERMDQIEGLMLFPELLHALEIMDKARKKFDLSHLEAARIGG